MNDTALENTEIITIEPITVLNARALGDAIKWQADAHKYDLPKNPEETAKRYAGVLSEEWTRDDHNDNSNFRTVGGYVLRVGHEIQAYATYSLGFNESGKPEIYVEDLCVNPNLNYRGFGEFLFAHVAMKAREAGYDNVRFEVDNQNAHMRKWLSKKFNVSASGEKNYRLPVDIDSIDDMEISDYHTRPVTIEDAELLATLDIDKDAIEALEKHSIVGFATVDEDGTALGATFCTLSATTFDPQMTLIMKQTHFKQGLSHAEQRATALSAVNGVLHFCTDPKLRSESAEDEHTARFLGDLNISETRWHVDDKSILQEVLKEMGAKEYRLRPNDRYSIMDPHTCDASVLIKGLPEKLRSTNIKIVTSTSQDFSTPDVPHVA